MVTFFASIDDPPIVTFSEPAALTRMVTWAFRRGTITDTGPFGFFAMK